MKYLRVLALTVTTIAGISTWAVGQNWPWPSQRRGYYGDRNLGTWSSPAYRQGVRQGRWDAQHDRRPNWRNNNWSDEQDRFDYQAGYKWGYREVAMAENGGQGAGRDNRDTAAYRQGIQDGRWDAEHNRRSSPRGDGWGSWEDRRDYAAGYNRGYQGSAAANNGAPYANNGGPYGGGNGYNRESGSIRIDRNTVTWETHGVNNARVFLHAEDSGQEQVFAEGTSGTQPAPWAQPGRSYLFILRDMNGNELGRAQMDLGNGYRR